MIDSKIWVNLNWTLNQYISENNIQISKNS